MAVVRSARAPLVAILTMPDDQKKFRGNRQNFIDIIETGKTMGVHVVVVTTRDLYPDRDRVIAYDYDSDTKQWKPRWFPLPHVIYNRIPFREDEQQPEVRQLILACLRHPQIQLYNPYFFNKWELFHWLNRSAITRPYIPYTRKYSKKTRLLPLLKRFPYLYLKPQSGKAGRGIMRLRRKVSAKWPYQLSIQESKKSQTLHFARLADMRKHLEKLIGDEAYIIQQGIRLTKVNGRPFDLRILIQKNKRGKWKVTGIGARMAGEESITTHVPRGGTIEDPRKLLTASFGNTATKSLLRRVAAATVRMARQIERGCGNPLGEMSIDLGVDVNGKLWFFEANSKPMKFDEPDIRVKSLRTIIEYCTYLAKRTKKTGGGRVAR